MTPMRAAALGVAYAMAVAAVDSWVVGLRSIELRIPISVGATLTVNALTLLLGLVLGLLTWPLRRVARGAWLQLAVVSASWIALARIVAPNPHDLPQWLLAPAAGLVITVLGLALARRRSALAWSLGLLVLFCGMALTHVIAALRDTPPAVSLEQGTPATDAPDVVMIVLDTVRAQSTSAYGYRRATTPVLAALADEGALFLDATSPSTWSLPSHASLFTGWYPSAHGAHGENRVLGPTPPTLAEVLWRNGYDTLSFTANPHISEAFGLSRGFAWSDRAYLSSGAGRSFVFIFRVLDLLGYSADDKGGGQVASNFAEWAAARPLDSRPAFVFLNFLEAHFPYHQVPKRFLAQFTDRAPGELRRFSLETFGAQFGRPLSAEEAAAAIGPTTDMYDAGVLYSDHLLSRVVDAIGKSGRLDRTVLVVLADHGELLGEHGHFGHGPSLLQPDLHVPLVVRYPPAVRAGARIEQPVSTLGVYATVLDLLDIEPPAPVHVGSLLPSVEGHPLEHAVIAERFLTPMMPADGGLPLARNRRYRVYRSGDLKLVVDSTGQRHLFDLAADPDEREDLSPRRPQDLARINDELDRRASALGLPPLDAPLAASELPELDAATRRSLEALGYVD